MMIDSARPNLRSDSNWGRSSLDRGLLEAEDELQIVTMDELLKFVTEYLKENATSKVLVWTV